MVKKMKICKGCTNPCVIEIPDSDDEMFKFWVNNYPFNSFCNNCSSSFCKEVKKYEETGNISCFNCNYFKNEFKKEV